MTFSDQLPDHYVEMLSSLEASYLKSDDPVRQSGFGDGQVRWREEREPILDAITTDGALLDVGCANGYLLQCLAAWGQERGIQITPYGLDIGPRLIKLARRRLPMYADHFFVGNARNWEPPRTFRYVYALYDAVPDEYFAEFVRRLLTRTVALNGRLIIGAYGSRSGQQAPLEIADLLQSSGFTVAGVAQGGMPTNARFAWIVAGASMGNSPCSASDL